MKAKYLLILLSIVLVDIATKIVAINTLPFQEYVFLVKDKIGFYLIYNEGSTGGQADYLLQQESNKNISLIFSSVSSLLLLSYIVLIFNRKIRKIYKWLIGLSIWILISVIFQLIKPAFLDVAVSNWTTSVITKFASFSLYLAIFLLTKNNLIKLFSFIIISAGIGNLINHFYYPYQVIDFIYVKGSYELFKIGVFNLADVAFDIGFIGLIVSVISIVINKIRITAHHPSGHKHQ